MDLLISNVCSRGCHDSGVQHAALCLVTRSAAPVPSARCSQTPTPPSRSDENATRSPSRVHTGKRLRASSVSGRMT